VAEPSELALLGVAALAVLAPAALVAFALWLDYLRDERDAD
jgi:hypothetical protein